MTTRHARIRAIFELVLGAPLRERSAVLERECDGDAALRDEVESLLRHADAPAIDLDGASEALRATLVSAARTAARPPANIGAYRIIDVLGEGGMGIVYRAQQQNPRRVVALKVIRPGLATPSMLRRFEREAQVLGRLRHPGIAQIYEAGSADTGGGVQPYFAMELIEGRPLLGYVAGEALSLRRRLELIVSICRAAAHAHEQGVIHRDLKPGNVLVDAYGQPKILDFGVARSTDLTEGAATLMTSTGQIVGTLAYMSPEQVSGGSSRVDARSDVYSLGVLMYEVLSGEAPFDISGLSLPEAIRVIAEHDLTLSGTASRIFRGDLDKVVRKALEKDPARRYQSALELAADIERYLDDQPVFARRPSALYQLGKLARRHRVLFSAAMIVFLSVIAAAIVSLKFAADARFEASQSRLAEAEQKRLRGEADAKTREAEWRAYVASLAAADSALAADDPEAAAISLEQVAEDRKANWEWQHLRSRLHSHMLAWDAGPTSLMSVRFGADDAWVALLCFGWSVRLVEVDGLKQRTLVDLPEVPLFGLGLSTDGSLIAVGETTGTVRRWRTADGVAAGVIEKAVEALHDGALDPSGRRYAAAGARGSASVIDFDTGSIQPLQGHTGFVGDLAWNSEGTRLASASSDRTIRIWAADVNGTLRCTALLEGHELAARSVVWLPDSRGLLSSGADSTIRMWDVDGRELAVWHGQGADLAQVRVSPDGTLAISRSLEQVIDVWRVRDGKPLRSIAGPWASITDLDWSADGSVFAASSIDGSLFLWDAALVEGHEGLRVAGHFPTSMTLSGDGTTAVTSGNDGVRVWDLVKAECVMHVPENRPKQALGALTPDGRTAFASKPGGRIAAFGVPSKRSLFELDSGWAEASVGEVDPLGERLAAIGSNGELGIWILATRERVATIHDAAARLAGVAWSTDGRVLATVTVGGATILRDRDGGNPRSFKPGPAPAVAVAAGQGGSGVVTAHNDGSIRMWSALEASDVTDANDARHATAAVAAPVMKGAIAPMCIAMNPVGTRVAAGQSDATIRLYDTETGAEMCTLRGHHFTVRALAWSPDGERLVSVDGGGLIRTWDVVPDSERLREMRAREPLREYMNTAERLSRSARAE